MTSDLKDARKFLSSSSSSILISGSEADKTRQTNRQNHDGKMLKTYILNADCADVLIS